MSSSAPEEFHTQPRSEIDGALSLAAVLLGGMFVVARPIARQFEPYGTDAAFTALIALMLASVVSARTLLARNSAHSAARFSMPVAVLLALWLGLHLVGLMRSPNLGMGLPQFCDIAGYLLLLLTGYQLMRHDRGATTLLLAGMIGIIGVEAAAAIWQHHVDLPRLWQSVDAGREFLPPELESNTGQWRLRGDDAFATFGNPNSLAGFLLIGICLLASGLFTPGSEKPIRFARICAVAVIGAMLYALWVTHSKGGCVAAAAGLWLLTVQQISMRRPNIGRGLSWLTAAGIAGMVAILALGLIGVLGPKPFGDSIQVRLEYWTSALGMIRDHPLAGTGLYGYPENYSFYKLPLGTEVKDAHNDYINFWAELGPLAPLTYLALWWFVLKSPATSDPTPEIHDAAPDRRLRLTFVTGGVLALLMSFVAFHPFNSLEALAYLSGEQSGANLSGLIHSLTLPILFAALVFLLEPLFRADNAWVPGARAAIGAVLIHQIVDFDIKAQAVAGSVFLMAGMLLARQENSADNAVSRPSRFVPLMTLLLSGALLYPAVIVPITSGLPRANAESLEIDARQIASGATALRVELSREPEYVYVLLEIIAARQKAADAAPYDSAAWTELALAKEALQQIRFNADQAKEIRTCLEKAVRLRPLAAASKLTLGDYIFREASRLPANSTESKTRAAEALEWYSGAIARYPFAPGLHLARGDALLLMGDLQAADAAYLDALKVDTQILDVNVYLSSIFTDLRPGAFVKHGHDRDILNRLSRAPQLSRGLLLRRMISIVWSILQSRRKPGGTPALPALIENDLAETLEQLIAATEDTTERAHLALFAALSHELRRSPFQPEKKAQDWARARELQEATFKSARPGTLPPAFEFLWKQYGAKK